MPYWLAHAHTSLQKIATDGSVSTLTLPTGTTIVATRRARFAILNEVVAVVNAGTKNLAIDASLVVRVLSIPVPSSAPVTAIGAGGVLTGVYFWKVSFAELSGAVVISESPLSAASITLTLTADQASLTSVPVAAAGNGVTHRRIYRTAAGGSAYFLVGTIADNTTTTYTDNATDESIAAASVATDLGNPPGTTTADRIDVIAAWKDRLWGASTDDVDRAYYSGIDRFFAWASTQYLPIKPVGQDVEGITAFLPRRDELGVAKRRSLSKIIGNTQAKLEVINVHKGVGVWAPESVVVIRDVAYFLAEDGVYSWGPEGVQKISTEKVDPWFTRDDTFNRALWSSAFAKWNQREDTYELHMARIGSSVIDRWVSYDLQTGLWLGPHKTDAFTVSAGGMLENEIGQSMAVMGAQEGYLYRQNDPSYADVAGSGSGTAYAIDQNWDLAWDTANMPSLTKYFGDVTVLSKIETAGVLTVTPYVGGLDAAAGTARSHTLTTGRERLGRLGVGRAVRLNFRQATAYVGCTLYGYEIPINVVGLR